MGPGTHIDYSAPSLYAWGVLAGGAVGMASVPLVVAGATAAPLAAPIAVRVGMGLGQKFLYYGTRPLVWAGYNVAVEAEGLYHWAKDPSGVEYSPELKVEKRPIALRGWFHRVVPIVIPFPYLDMIHSSGGGGPGESLASTNKGAMLHQGNRPHRPGPKVAAPRATWGRRAGKHRKSCPPGYRWNGSRCVRK
jgi:hypothetical protein